jgi:hypothetical protein
MNPAVLVLTPAIGFTADGTSSTYTPGDKYCGISSSFAIDVAYN